MPVVPLGGGSGGPDGASPEAAAGRQVSGASDNDTNSSADGHSSSMDGPSSEMSSELSPRRKPATRVHVPMEATNPQLALACKEDDGKGCVRGILQQREPWVLAPLWMFRPLPQACCSLLAALISALTGVLILMESAKMQEISVSYDHTVDQTTFVVDKTITSDVLVSYELPDTYMNVKALVEGKDRGILQKATLSFISSMSCEGAETKREAISRRPTADWESVVDAPNIGEVDFRPCGLLANAMFADEYQFFQATADGGWELLAVDESDLAWPGDDELFANDGFQLGSGQNGTDFAIDESPSWLQSGAFLEHFKVWYRNPASPVVRNLWARIPGGLPAGTYKVSFTKNGPIWTSQWSVSEKRLIFANSHSLGGKGAATLVGGVFVALGSVEALMVLVFLVGHRVYKQKILVDDTRSKWAQDVKPSQAAVRLSNGTPPPAELAGSRQPQASPGPLPVGSFIN